MDFYGFSTGRNAYILVGFCILDPFFASRECWCALMLVLSMDRSCMSASTVRISNIFSITPSFDQRPNLLYKVLQEPYRSGKSRHGVPLRAIHRIPFNEVRLSLMDVRVYWFVPVVAYLLYVPIRYLLFRICVSLTFFITLRDISRFWLLCHFRTDPMKY